MDFKLFVIEKLFEHTQSEWKNKQIYTAQILKKQNKTKTYIVY